MGKSQNCWDNAEFLENKQMRTELRWSILSELSGVHEQGARQDDRSIYNIQGSSAQGISTVDRMREGCGNV